MIFLEKNLAALAKKQPELAEALRRVSVEPQYQTVPSKSGQLSLKVGGIALHSMYDPVKEAEKLASTLDITLRGAVVLKGFGLGYLAEILVSRGLALLVMEADLVILRLALENRDLTAVIADAAFYTPAEQGAFSEFLGKRGLFTGITHIDHPPSIKLHQEFYLNPQYRGQVNLEAEKAVAERAGFSLPKAERSKAKTSRRLRIFLPSPLYGGSLPVAGYCKKALEALGHTVEYFDCTTFYPVFKSIEEITANPDSQTKLKSQYTVFIGQAVFTKAMEFKPDIVFGVAQSPFTRQSLADFKAAGIPTAYWFVEDYQVLTYWRNYAQLYDYFFVIQRGEFAQILDAMKVDHYYLPMAAEPEIHRPLQLSAEEKREFGSALSFVGAGYPNRKTFFRGLTGENFKLWGVEWDSVMELQAVLQRNGERIPTEESVKIFNASDININLHSWMEMGGINPKGDFVNPRTFEIAACGAFQLCDMRAELGNCFEIGKEIAVFQGYEDFLKQKDYYLRNPEARKQMAEAGRKRILREHTYFHRMQEMLKIAMGIEPEIQQSATEIPVENIAAADSPNRVENLMKSVGDNEELRAVFSAFPPDEVLDVDKIAKHIAAKKEGLNKTEGVFLLMKEFSDWAKQKKVI